MKIDVKNIIIIILLVAVLALTLILTLHHIKKPSVKIDGSNMTSTELVEMFKNEGYNIELTYIDTYLHMCLENKKEGITFQKVPNVYIGTSIGTLLSFKDSTINSEWADLSNLSSNNTEEKEQQYRAYKTWLDYYNVTKNQISDMLDYYFINHEDEIDYIDTNKLLYGD